MSWLQLLWLLVWSRIRRKFLSTLERFKYDRQTTTKLIGLEIEYAAGLSSNEGANHLQTTWDGSWSFFDPSVHPRDHLHFVSDSIWRIKAKDLRVQVGLWKESGEWELIHDDVRGIIESRLHHSYLRELMRKGEM